MQLEGPVSVVDASPAALNDYGNKGPKAMITLETDFENAIAVLALPGIYQRRLRTTNPGPVERRDPTPGEDYSDSSK